ncbi:hypothetical protein WMF28_34230 [Sorangium sp. So ce590]|uniref:hypothetical protein n=1 Tax=Sorangium sp. So ce590 TaxID=3133317 RepID=UPI003F5ED982
MLRSALVVCWSHAAAVAMFLLALTPAFAAPPPRSPRVVALIREAEAAFERLDIARARDLWAQIYDIERSTVGICQLGQLDRRLGRWVDAVVELTRCVREMRPPATPRERKLHETRHADLAAARRQVAELRVFAPAGAAPVLVDGRLVDESGRIYVAPGQHEVAAAMPDGRTVRSTVHVTAGESEPRAVLLSAEPASLPLVAPPPARPAGAPAQPAAPPGRWLLYAGSAASGAFLVSGIVLHIVASLEDSALRDEMCKPDWEETDAARRAMNTIDVEQHVSTAALVAGSVLGAATLVVAVLPSNAQVRASARGAEVRFAW